MAYPTHIRIPFAPATVDVIRKVFVTFGDGLTSLPVVLDDGTLGTASVDDCLREWRIARKTGDLQASESDEQAEQARQAVLQAEIDALIAERTP